MGSHRSLGLLIVLIGLALVGAGCNACSVQARTRAKVSRRAPTMKAEVAAPASVSPAQALAVRVARSHDPRDRDPDYAFTDVPGDVFTVPGEFEPVQTLLLAFADDALELMDRFVELIEAGQREARVVVLYNSEAALGELTMALSRAGVELLDVTFEQVPLDSAWIRDWGPTFALTTGGGFRILDTRYFEARISDDLVPSELGALWGFPVSRPPIITEGGNLLTDGLGRCVVSEQVLVRNEVWDIMELGDVYGSYFGCTHTVVVPPLAGEATGHVDMFATITGPGQIMVGAYPPGEDDENAQRLDEAAVKLRDAGFAVRRVPMPSNQDGRFRSYTNALALNGVVFVPVYADDQRFEDQALAVFAAAYPGRRLLPIDATDLIQWSGAVHCLTVTVAQ